MIVAEVLDDLGVVVRASSGRAQAQAAVRVEDLLIAEHPASSTRDGPGRPAGMFASDIGASPLKPA